MKNAIDKNMHIAVANVKGSTEFPNIRGTVTFEKKNEGVLVTAEISGLPVPNSVCGNNIFAFHIHNGSSCTGNSEDEFANVGTHLDLTGCGHPEHTGDLPPLFSNNGYAYLSVYTNRFKINDIIGRVVIIHDKSDDFTSQPSGNSGKKIACGKIVLP